ncbi:hypothetical protein BDV34DRAFT_87060 [Aspergillus parasiticus]|uniref:Uncharacterized protein n=1 Tax=Aspergillus parasiticus TaxID=5067 RepID=A0A5N6E453_ASPPA|nr:hypothetical protein BDV34DRAFT_87060 [Aspergillus parasiticus]
MTLLVRRWCRSHATRHALRVLHGSSPSGDSRNVGTVPRKPMQLDPSPSRSYSDRQHKFRVTIMLVAVVMHYSVYATGQHVDCYFCLEVRYCIPYTV